MKKCVKCGTEYPDEYKFCLKDGGNLIISVSLKQIKENAEVLMKKYEVKKRASDSWEWVKLHKITVIGAVVSIIAIFGIYQYLKPNPETDAKKAVAEYCRCVEQHNDETIKVNESFLNSFASTNFKKRQDARKSWQDSQNSADNAELECQNSAKLKATEARNQYLSDNYRLQKFDLIYNDKNGFCNATNQTKLNATNTEIENRILSIKDPTPDIEKIKSDLIGHSITGWSFDSLSEFKNVEILETESADERLEMKIKLKLYGESSNSEHDAEVLVVYTKGEDDWYFDSVKMNYITYTNKASVGEWGRVNPLKNCSYEIQNNGKKYFAKDGEYGTIYQGGPGGEKFNLTNSTVYIMSREEYPIDLIFKYTPKD